MAEAVLRKQQSEGKKPSSSLNVAVSADTHKPEKAPPTKTLSQPPNIDKPPASTSSEGRSTRTSSAEKLSAQQDKFQNEVLAVLSTINKNQNAQDKRLKQIEIKIAEYDETEFNPDSYEYEEYDCSVEQTDENNNDSRSVITEIKPSVTQNSADVFEGIFKKYNQIDEVDSAVNGNLATMVNKVFREGISDDKLQKLLKETHRPDNCDSLVKTRVNNLVWNLLSPQIHTIDSNMQKIQEAMIKAAIIFTKLLSVNASILHETQIEAGTDTLGLLGQANKLLNLRRKELHKSNLNPEYHFLCSASQKFTDMLYGDDISKNVKEIQDVNKIGTRIKGSSQSSYQNRGRGGRFRGVMRGRVTKNRGRGRGSYTPKSKNQLSEHSKK